MLLLALGFCKPLVLILLKFLVFTFVYVSHFVKQKFGFLAKCKSLGSGFLIFFEYF